MATINGTNNNDWLSGTAGADSIFGFNGQDTLKGGGGADRLDGGAHWDTAIYADSSAPVTVDLAQGRGYGGTAEGDTLFSIEGVWGSGYGDTLLGNYLANDLYGLDGDDVLWGGDGGDYIDGGGGNDHLKGGGGDDFLDGGAGIDWADYSGAKHGITVDLLHNSTSYSYYTGTDAIYNVENVSGSDYVDSLYGDNGNNVLRGWNGNDLLSGRGGNDTLQGGYGNDNLMGGDGFNTLFGEEGNDVLHGNDNGDVLYGGNGDDRYYLDNYGASSSVVVVEYAGGGYDWVFTSNDFTLPAEVERLDAEFLYATYALNLTGNAIGNTIVGNYGDNVIDGGAGVDNLIGRHGNDTYVVDQSSDRVSDFAGQGNLDRVRTGVTYQLEALREIEVLETTNPGGATAIDLVGNEFNQTIIGNAATNAIVGGLGRDTMTGGAAGDVFVWRSTDETSLAGQEADVVTDFNRAGGDLLAFNPIDANAMGGTANDTFTFVGVVDVTQGGSFTAPGQIGYFTTGTDTYILLNTEVDAGIDYQDATIRVAGVHNVDASWFVL
jgi:Ca2+-binding RTX toxin-like protein